MKMRLSFAALTMALALSGAVSATPAKTKWSAEHKAAVKKCNEDYHATLKEDKSKKGKERKEADAAARKTRKQCIADAPK
jgi:hypothetical protein